MTWQNPKTNWGAFPAQDGLKNSDYNRIEGNTLYLYNVLSGMPAKSVFTLDNNQEQVFGEFPTYTGIQVDLYAFGENHKSRIIGYIVAASGVQNPVYSISLVDNNTELYTGSSGSRVKIERFFTGGGTTLSYRVRNETGQNNIQITMFTTMV